MTRARHAAIARRGTAPTGMGARLADQCQPLAWSAGGNLLAPSAFGHSGSTGTVVWVDPVREVICVLFTNEPAGQQRVAGTGVKFGTKWRWDRRTKRHHALRPSEALLTSY
ncbi:MAG: serine hydrolase [Caldilineaceae bacterium]